MITVGISDLNVAKAPDVLVTYALGSCVGICLYDSFTRVAGLSHIMLPSSTLSRDKSQPARYADTAIPLLIQRMVAAGANKSRLRAKICGRCKDVCHCIEQLTCQHRPAECHGCQGDPSGQWNPDPGR